MKRIVRSLLAVAALALLAALAIAVWAWPRAELLPSASPADWAATPTNIARGAYLARAGDCVACHTARGGVPYAGGRTLDTPFGRFVAPNITPDAATGIGNWSADDFWNALHNGIGRDGRLLYPAFPYTSYTKMPRADADALYAYLRSLAPVRQATAPHELRFPYDRQWALAGWRLLYFRPGVHADDPARTPAWNRGAYLVEGPGHCVACHGERNGLGATGSALTGGLIPSLGWYAPGLGQDRPVPDLVRLLRTGVSPEGAVSGPMADVVAHSLQHLSEPDLTAMATYLASLPAPRTERGPASVPPEESMKTGRRLYERYCVDCHGADGRGALAAGSGLPAYPPLAGNRALTTDEPVNAIRIVLNGGFPPATAGNPRPFGMPPFSHVLKDDEVAAVVTYVRNSWGNAAPAVRPSEVNRHRAVPLD